MTAATTTIEKPEVMAISGASKALINEAQPFTPHGRVSRPVSHR